MNLKVSRRDGDITYSKKLALMVFMCLFTWICTMPLKALEGNMAEIAGENECFQQGTASWYAGEFDGKLTANGEIFDASGISAAHKTLPFGTIVRVTNLINGLQVDVRINDRGPFVDDRIIDLSLGAAVMIDMVERGIAPVSLEILYSPDIPETAYIKAEDTGMIKIQLGSFTKASSIVQLYLDISHMGYIPFIERVDTGHYRIQARWIRIDSLDQAKADFQEAGYSSILVKSDIPNEALARKLRF